MHYKTKYIFLAAIFSIIVIVLFFYLVLRNKSQDFSQNEPYASIIGKKLFSLEASTIIKSDVINRFKDYPFQLEDFKTIDTARVDHIIIPKGSIFQFDQAIRVDKAVSGSKYVYLLGFVINKESQEKTAIIYNWGSFKDLCISEPCHYWEHRKAPWQSEIDTTKYFKN
jgi:hypothetical protein